MAEHFDVIIIGTRVGGGTLLSRLAPGGKRILVLEPGPFLPREEENWSCKGSFKYYSSEAMYNKEGGETRPGFRYFVGGNTKVYGAALFRLREKDFEAFRHRDGTSPKEPIKSRARDTHARDGCKCSPRGRPSARTAGCAIFIGRTQNDETNCNRAAGAGGNFLTPWTT